MSEVADNVPIFNLPEEILLEIFKYLSTGTLLCGVAQACQSWYWLVRRESELGRIIKNVTIDRNRLGALQTELVETVEEILNCHRLEILRPIYAFNLRAQFCNKLIHLEYKNILFVL